MSLDTLNDFINETFTSNPTGNGARFEIDNNLDIDIEVLRMSSSGSVADAITIKRNKDKSVDGVRQGEVFVVRSKDTLAWIRSITIAAQDVGTRAKVRSSDLIALDSASFDRPRVISKVPQGPTLVMVGLGETNNRTVTESLFWNQTADVFVPASTTVTETLSETNGTTLTETESMELAVQLGVEFTAEADLFFGKVSTTLSTTFTTSTSFTRSFAVSKSTTRSVATPFTNATSKNVVMFRYQLVQRVSVFKDGDLKSTLENALPVFKLETVTQ
ncbi:hypothetical protein ACNOYE_03185 [Nannocystaceae bacterium ST9]